MVFSNLTPICVALNRPQEHVVAYILNELATTGNVDGADPPRLVIKGRFQPKQLESVLKRYITNYVLCSHCKSHNTTLLKENRLQFLQCLDCHAKKSVSNVSVVGYRAQIGKRRKR